MARRSHSIRRNGSSQQHPSRSLTRITYEPAGYGRPAYGTGALARAIEHIHFGWALLAFVIRLPVLRSVIQLLADAAGAAPQRLTSADLAAHRSTCE
jgi:hypothetical protein